jgi:lauroyl/myristoyl acyltransferase
LIRYPLQRPPFRIPRPSEIELQLSEVVRRAVAAHGGSDAVYDSLIRLEQWSIPVVLGVFATKRHAHSNVLSIDGLEEVVAAHRAGRGLVVVETHTGPTFAIGLTLLSRRIPIAQIGLYDANEISRLFDRYGRWLWPLRNGTLFRPIVARSILAGVSSLKALERGSALLWQADVLSTFDTSRNTCEIEVLGHRKQITNLLFEMVTRTRVPVFVAGARVHGLEERRPRVSVWFRPIDPPLDSPGDFLREVYRSVESDILENFDQWERWEVYPNF